MNIPPPKEGDRAQIANKQTYRHRSCNLPERGGATFMSEHPTPSRQTLLSRLRDALTGLALHLGLIRSDAPRSRNPLAWLGSRGHARHQAGWRAEEYAARQLRKHGYAIKGRNVPAGDGEIDIVAQHDRRLVFVEVRARTVGSVMRPVDTVRAKKQRQVITCAHAYMRERGYDRKQVEPRYDVAEVWLDGAGEPCAFNVVEDAFRKRPSRRKRSSLAQAPGLQRNRGGGSGKWRAVGRR